VRAATSGVWMRRFSRDAPGTVPSTIVTGPGGCRLGDEVQVNLCIVTGFARVFVKRREPAEQGVDRLHGIGHQMSSICLRRILIQLAVDS
jgi:hypothetical protein